MIDAGPASARQDIVDYLNSQNVDTLKYLILTHPHLDHIGSATEVLENFEVNNVILPDFSSGIVSTSKAYKDVLQTIKNNKIKAQIAKKGDILPLGNGEFEVLLAYAKESENLNDISIVTMFKSEDIKFLSAGDAEDITETELLDSGVDLSADVFKASHHGSYTSNGYKFVEQVNPKICVISCGADNSFGHPHFSTIETLRELKVRYWQTQYAGTVVVCVSNGELVVVPEHEEEYDGIYD